jgi:hypothetical protein
MARRRVSGSREDELVEAGTSAFVSSLPPGPLMSYHEEAMIRAIAAMLTKADIQRRRKPEKLVEDVPLPFSPREFYSQLRARVGHLVITEPVENRLFGYLGGRLKQINGLERSDMDNVIGWIEAGGLRDWKVMPTFKHVINNIDKFIGYGRVWNARGRQQLGPGTKNVGADTPEVDPGSEFR